MKTTLTCINRNDSLRPVAPQATQTLLDEKKIPALQEQQYEQWAEYLFSANLPLRLQVAETVFRQNRQHSQALALFLACAYPSAQRIAAREFDKMCPRPASFTQELLYDGAVNGAIRMFQHDQFGDETDFQPAFYLALKQGAMRAAFGSRMKTACVRSFGTRDQRPRGSRIEDQLIAKEILEQITNLEPEPDTARLYKFVRTIIEIGPHDVLKSFRYGTSLEIDFEPVIEQLGISIWTARQYLSQARQMLKAKFDPDGSFFIKH